MSSMETAARSPGGRERGAASAAASRSNPGKRAVSPVEIQFTGRPLAQAEALVLGVWEGGNPTAAARALGADRWIGQALHHLPAFTGKSGNALLLHPPRCDDSGTPLPAQVVLTGLGQFGAMDAETARRCGAEVGAVLMANGITSAAIDLGLEPLMAAFFVLGLRLRCAPMPDYRRHEADGPEAPRPLRLISVRVGDPRMAETAWAQLRAAAEGVELARRLTAEPANILTPARMIEKAQGLSKLRVSVEVLDAERLAAEGMNLHLAVGRGSAQPPALVVMRWRGAGDGSAPVLVVGKGLTFDSGGLCIKPAAGMEEMKGDMGGAATVLGLLHAVATAQTPVNVTGIMALAENMTDGAAYRPGDVYTSHAGLTVEVIDTDAEGRMVLADALSWGCATENPKAVIDLATLTGSIVVALGHHHAGLFCTDDALARGLIRSGQSTDELLWRMPLSEALDEDLKSDCADLKQCASAGRLLPDALHAARFLSHFVPDGTPWAHLDIAGVSERATATAHMPVGPTGFGVLTLFDWLTDQF